MTFPTIQSGPQSVTEGLRRHSPARPEGNGKAVDGLG
ncbi:hypothetical protein ATDW_36920 (plasmid) [Asticcacaulis sp. DW145]|nr:hypothetical protein ATDW_36920 [Asticcacaulis sp. DW145]